MKAGFFAQSDTLTKQLNIFGVLGKYIFITAKD